MKAPHIQLKADLLRALICVQDFGDALGYLVAYKGLSTSHESAWLRRATLLASIVSYSRPFLASKAGPNGESAKVIPLEPEAVLTADQMRTHRQVIDLRDSALAHSDFKHYQAELIGHAPGIALASRRFELLDQGVEPAAFGPVIDAMFRATQERMHALSRALPETPGGHA